MGLAVTVKQHGSAAAHYAQKIRDQVLVATYEGHPADARQAAMVIVWTLWPKLCRAMSELETLCPRTSEQGAQIDAEQRDTVEAFQDRLAL